MSAKNPQQDSWTSRWNERYKSETFAYGEAPNRFFQEVLKQLTPGTMLLPAEGEGRNAVYAAKIGWSVTAFDISEEGKNKAMKLATQQQVTIDYQVNTLENLHFEENQFDALALIYAHFPATIKAAYHRMLDQYVKVNGVIIFEAFSKQHLAYVTANEKVGGPKDIDSLFSLEEIKADFPNYEYLLLEEKIIELNEGVFHNGTGSVIRLIGKKTTHRSAL